MKQRSQSYAVYFLLFVAIIVLVVFSLNKNNAADTVLSINQLADEIQQGNISRIVEEENELTEDMVKITAVNEEKEYYDKYIWPASLISLGASLTSLGMVIHLYTKSKK